MSSQTDDGFAAPEEEVPEPLGPRRGKGGGCLPRGCVVALIVALLVVAIGFFTCQRAVKQMAVTDPAEARAMAQRIIGHLVPAGFEPELGLKLAQLGETVVYTRGEEGEGGMILVARFAAETKQDEVLRELGSLRNRRAQEIAQEACQVSGRPAVCVSARSRSDREVTRWSGVFIPDRDQTVVVFYLADEGEKVDAADRFDPQLAQALLDSLQLPASR